MKRRLPIGTQTFSIIRRNGYAYADKSDLIYGLANDYRMVFLSRPRRFGKSLLVSTLEAYFSGRKDLFEGLAIESLEKQWEEYSVIRIDFSRGSYGIGGNFEMTTDAILAEYEERCGIAANSKGASQRLDHLIRELHAKTSKKVVVLIDEYDKPILDALGKPHEDSNRERLRDFYSPLKACDEHLRFVFLTGITKVSHANIFSGLNQLVDISLSDRFSTICGITDEELLDCFGDEMMSLAESNRMSLDSCRNELKRMYDGYSFSKACRWVYNPFCLLRSLDSGEFGSYWMESGTPSMLVKHLRNHVVMVNGIMQDGLEVGPNFFADYDPESNDIVPLLYQTGYLTIKGYDAESRLYLLGFPNSEVSECLMGYLLPKFLSYAECSDSGVSIEHFRRALLDGDAAKVAAIVSSCVSSIPTVTRESCENYYESIVHVLFRATGFEVVSQMQSSAGRARLVLQTPRSVWIFELKMDGRSGDVAGLCDAALRQIVEKGYAKPYEASGKLIRNVALVFSSAKLGLAGWKEEVSD